ncbi:MAG TPA: M15 family metallopeptidase, partial [Gemmatimonadaceae bacterium]|nr:M15 family metallopeptidase [Gemmatimonadaceae bacterium]
ADTEKIDGKPVAKVIAARARELVNAYRKRFPEQVLIIRSGWRSNNEQWKLYEEWVEGTRESVVGFPGTSNHQNGYALDLFVGARDDTRTFAVGKIEIAWSDNDFYRWLAENAPAMGWRRTVPSEPWHWEYRPRLKQRFPLLPD